MMKKNLKYLLALLCIIVLLLCTGCSSDSAAPQPISVTVWTYYNGTLLESFNTLVKTFNETVGKEKGIIVEAYSQGSVNELEASVMQSAEGKVGAAAMPNIFSAYADTAYALDKLGLVVDVSSYLTADERAAYVDNYLTEGDFGQTGSIKIFPVAKSTELLFLNETDWRLLPRRPARRKARCSPSRVCLPSPSATTTGQTRRPTRLMTARPSSGATQ